MILSLLPRWAKAQYDPSFVNYWAMTPFYNPAATGQSPVLNFQGAYSMQMTGFENAPAVMYAYVDLPLFFISARHGAGVGFTNDQIGLFKHQKFFSAICLSSAFVGRQTERRYPFVHAQ